MAEADPGLGDEKINYQEYVVPAFLTQVPMSFFLLAPFFCTEKEKSLQSTKAVCPWNSPTMKASSWLRAIFLFSTEMDQLKSHPICCLPFAQFVLKPRRKPEIFENWQNIDKNLASSRIAIHHYH